MGASKQQRLHFWVNDSFDLQTAWQPTFSYSLLYSTIAFPRENFGHDKWAKRAPPKIPLNKNRLTETRDPRLISQTEFDGDI